MKKIIFSILAIILLISCKKTPEPEEKDVFGEIIYTDTFSPSDWENPNARIKIEAEDKDIGKFIKENTLDQKYLKVNETIKDFISSIQNKNNDEIQKLLTSAAYDSFNLRMPVIPPDKKYKLRVAFPENVDADKFWLNFKIMFSNASVVAKIEVEKNGKNYRISDMESKFFTDLDEAVKGKIKKEAKK